MSLKFKTENDNVCYTIMEDVRGGWWDHKNIQMINHVSLYLYRSN